MPNSTNTSNNLFNASIYTGTTATTLTYSTTARYSVSIADMLRYRETELQPAQTPAQPPASTWVNPYANARRLHNWQEYDRDGNRRIDYTRQSYDGYAMQERIVDIMRAIRRVSMQSGYYDTFDHAQYGMEHITREDAKQHTWFRREADNHKLHKAVLEAIKVKPPKDLHDLVLQWPHQSLNDPARIAYTRSSEHGHADRQTLTSVGKYLRAHFPSLTDTELRDIVMRFGEHKFAFWDTVEGIIRAVQDGPKSCMQWHISQDEWDRHPYNVYDPKYGWRVEVRLDGTGRILGRCLVNISGDGKAEKIFVRSYAHKEGGYSHSDEALEVWLRDQGFVKADDWQGCKLAKITNYYKPFMAPYLDGCNKNVDDGGNHLLVDSDGHYLCESTEGYPSDCGHECEDCGAHVGDDDIVAVGPYEDRNVCRHCIENDYYWVLGHRRCHYYLHCDSAVHSSYTDEWYDRDYLSTNDMVELEDGEICPQDEAVHLESRDEWRHQDDEDVVYCERDGVYEHIDDTVELHDGERTHEDTAWQCDASGDWYHNDDSDEQVEICDLASCSHYVVHEDNLKEYYEVDLDDVADSCEEIVYNNELASN